MKNISLFGLINHHGKKFLHELGVASVDSPCDQYGPCRQLGSLLEGVLRSGRRNAGFSASAWPPQGSRCLHHHS